MSHDGHMLYLIDGHAQIFRSYFAIRGGMTSPVTGEPTNATFAFTGMLLKLFNQFEPRYVAMAIDSEGKTFRDEIYEDYKANREAPPEDFAVQIPRILEITRLFGVPVLSHQGAEADDIIATIATRLTASDHDGDRDVTVAIVSKDKDLEQLLGDRVKMFDIHTDTTIDVETLKETKGIAPEQVIDLLTLTGDSTDNIPGVAGVGTKTAAKLLQEFGSIDNLLANVDKIKGKRRENIEAARPFLDKARQLVTLKRDVPIDFKLEDAHVDQIDATALQRLFKKLGFNRHQRDLERLLDRYSSGPIASNPDDPTSDTALFATGLFPDDAQTADSPAASPSTPGRTTAADFDYRAVTTHDELDELAATLRRQKLIAVDSETVGLGHRTELCGLCFAWQAGSGVYVPVRSPKPSEHLDRETVLSALRDVLEDPSLPKCGHNVKYDWLVLEHAGVRMRGVVFDTMIAAFLVGAPGQALDHLALSELNHEMTPISALIGPRERGKPQKTMDQVPLEQVTAYAAEDADVTLRLYEKLKPRLTTLGMQELAERVEMPLVEVLAVMEANGIRVDPDVLDEQRRELEARIVELRDAIHEAAGEPFNIDSPKQLGEVLFQKLKLPVVKKTKTGASTDIEVLEKLADMDGLDASAQLVPGLIVEYRQLTKLVGTYLEALKQSIDAKTGRIHATFHQTGAATGRLSSSGPNLQNIPIRTDLGRQVRKAFVADPDHLLISVDYSQIELRLLAHLSEDPALLDAFRKGQDIHSAVAAQVFGLDPDAVTTEQRARAKVINFGIVYGITKYGLSRRIEGMSVEDADRLITEYRARFAGIDSFLAQCVEHARTHGYVRTMLGRRRSIPQIDSRNPQQRALGERLAINTVVQGSAADLIKLAMVNLHRRIEDESLSLRMLLQIHDELVLEAPAAQAEPMSAVVREAMEGAMELRVPLKAEVGVGPDWYSAK